MTGGRGSSRVAIVLLIAIAVVFLVTLVALNVERVPVTRDRGLAPEARRNRWLAAERLIRRMGLPCESEVGLDDLPPSDHSLFLRTTGATISRTRGHELLEWVERGGNLVLLVPAEGPHRAELVARIAQGATSYPFTEELGFEYVAAFTWLDDARPIEPYVGRETSHHVSFRADIRLQDRGGDAVESAGRSDARWLLAYRRGAGHVTAVASDAWMTNDEIGTADHAALAWELARRGGDRAGARLVYEERRAGLLALLARHWIVSASALALLVAWLWKRGARFGPLVAEPPRPRRDFAEHVEATGEYLWRARGTRTLLEAPRRELRARLAARRPHWDSLADDALARELAEHLAWPRERAAAILGPSASPSPPSFTRIVIDLEEAKESL